MTEYRLPDAAFRKVDESADALFYAAPRFVTHIDDRAIAAVTELYRETFAPDAALLDLMSSWVSHLPDEIRYGDVVGHGMNRDELAANPRLSRWFVQDLNRQTRLPLADAALDGAAICASIQYLQRPVEVLAELARVLKPGAPVVITFSNRCFPSKAVAIWTSLHPEDQCRLVRSYLRQAGFADVQVRDVLRPPGDPLWAVIGRAGALAP